MNFGVKIMKYYKNLKGEVYAYESEQERQEWGAPDLVEMTPEEVDAHINKPIELPDVQTVTKLALKRELEKRGIWQDFRALISSNDDLWDEWLIANDLRIDDPMAVTAATAMEWTPEQVQQLFNDIAYGTGDA